MEVMRSYNAENSVVIKRSNKKCSVRKLFEVDGKPAFRIDNVDYVFEWEEDNHTAKNIQTAKEYKSRKGIAQSIKEEVESKKIKILKVEVPKQEIPEKEEVKHEQYQKILTCVQNDIPVYLYGPAGSGKNHTLKQIADELKLEFFFTNSVQQEYKITGFIDAGGKYHETEFYKAFKDGGLFFLDEMDASIPEVLILLNAAIANRYFEFPNGKIDAHEDFRVVAAGNTVGSGATEQYTGRLQLDQATLDRFVLIEFNYSERIEMVLAKGNRELVEFIRGLRKQAEEKGIRATFSYRCIATVTKLEGKLELKEIIGMAVMKGFDKDTLSTFETKNSNKYEQALRRLQRGA